MTDQKEETNAEKTQAQLDFEEGVKLLDNQEFAQAASAFHNALLGFEEKNDEKGIANTSDKLADVCLKRGDQKTALQHLTRAFSICDKSGDQLSTTYIKKKIAQTSWRLKHYKEALNVYSDLLDAYMNFNNPAGAVQIFEELGEMYTEMGETAKAADALRTAAGIHKNFKHERQAALLLEKANKIESAGN